MKKIVNIFCLIIFLVFCLSAFAMKDNAQKNITPNWEKLSNNIFIDKNSVSINKHGYVSAWFKRYASEEDDLYNINGIPIYYEIVKYEADCVDDSLELMHVISVDKNDILLKNEPNNYNVFSSHKGVIDGEIYYNALCKYKKDNE